jgi:hypothetical protein
MVISELVTRQQRKERAFLRCDPPVFISVADGRRLLKAKATEGYRYQVRATERDLDVPSPAREIVKETMPASQLVWEYVSLNEKHKNEEAQNSGGLCIRS